MLSKEHAGHSKHTFPTTPDIREYHQMINTEIILIMFFAARDREVLYNQQKKTRPGADCDSEHELLIAKFRFKLKKVGETTRPFRYDLNQICYVEMIQWKW